MLKEIQLFVRLSLVTWPLLHSPQMYLNSHAMSIHICKNMQYLCYMYFVYIVYIDLLLTLYILLLYIAVGPHRDTGT